MQTKKIANFVDVTTSGLHSYLNVYFMEFQQYTDLRAGIKFCGREYYCALELALELIGGKWKPMMLYHLKNGALRASELQRRLRGVSNKMFTQTARALERDGLVHRELFPESPPRVEYSLTPMGASAIPLIMQMGYWGESVGEYSDDVS